ncbi:GNAT family N-acetyltransferase [Bernardetia sp. OM2101]|uniref:GNAT family N-acetyltransferase n=1 Tax=Bernardetia sp. OM2101 TaxID=3344876 RepID=UPI0035CF1BDE
MKKWLSPVTLEGNLVKLIPLLPSHKNELLEAASDGELWNLWFTSVPSQEKIDTYLDFAFSEQEANRALPFAIIDKKTDKIIGSTRFCNVVESNKRVEIGYTWYSKSYQRTGINTECKYLLLQYAFENLECIAVEFRTSWYNQASRKAILRLGAKQDGILRNHQIDSNGILRDTVVFSIINIEWQGVKKLLEFEMSRKR